MMRILMMDPLVKIFTQRVATVKLLSKISYITLPVTWQVLSIACDKFDF